MTANRVLGAFLIGVTALASFATGAVTGTTGAVRVIATPSNLRLGFTENNVRIRAFSEQLDRTLTSDLPVDISVPSSVPDAPSINLSPGVIPAGTRVESWLLHFDPIGIPGSPLTLQGSISFDTPVLGIEVLSASLDGTDMILGAAGSEYSFNETLRGLELAVGMAGIDTFDGIQLSSDRKTILTILSTQNSFDQVRIITAVPVPVPEPSTSALGLAGCLCLVARLGRLIYRRRRAP